MARLKLNTFKENCTSSRDVDALDFNSSGV